MENTFEDVRPHILEAIEHLRKIIDSLSRQQIANVTYNEMADLLQKIEDHANGRI